MWADLDRDPGIRLAVALSATAAGYLDLVLISGLVLLGAAVCSAVAAVLLNRAARLAPAPMRPSPPSPYWPPPSGPPLA